MWAPGTKLVLEENSKDSQSLRLSPETPSGYLLIVIYVLHVPTGNYASTNLIYIYIFHGPTGSYASYTYSIPQWKRLNAN